MSVLSVSRQERRATITLTRPDVLNAMSFEVFDALAAAAGELANERSLKVVVVRGAGRSFSSGIDLSALGSVVGSAADTIARAQEGFRRLNALPVPTVAVVQGHALGAGLQLALACDLRVVAEDAKLGLLEARYGLIPDLGGSTLLPRLVGPARAKKMIWLAEQVSGAEAAAIGLADITVPAADLDAAAEELVAHLENGPGTPHREAKMLIDRAHLRDIEDGMDAEASAQERCMTAPDLAENAARGMRAGEG